MRFIYLTSLFQTLQDESFDSFNDPRVDEHGAITMRGAKSFGIHYCGVQGGRTDPVDQSSAISTRLLYDVLDRQ